MGSRFFYFLFFLYLLPIIIILQPSTLEGDWMKMYWDGKSKNIIGKKIKKLRKSAGLTQKQLAEKL